MIGLLPPSTNQKRLTALRFAGLHCEIEHVPENPLAVFPTRKLLGPRDADDSFTQN